MKLKDCYGRVMPKNALIIRHTEVTQFFNCRRDWFFSSHNGLNLEPAERSPKLRFGSCWHSGLEHYYSQQKPNSDVLLEGFSIEFDKEKEELEKQLGDGIYEETVQQMLEEEFELAKSLAIPYTEWEQSPHTRPSRQELEVIDVENRVIVPIPTPKGNPSRAYLAVKFDTIVKEQSFYWIMEHKTRAKSGRVDNPSNLSLDVQMGLQLYAAQIFYKRPFVGAIYNLTRKQKPGPRVKAPIFGRHEVTRSKQEINHLVNELYYISLEMRRAQRDPKARFYNPQPWEGYCTWGCGFRRVCESMNRGEDIEHLLSTMYKPREKSIWETLEEEMNNE